MYIVRVLESDIYKIEGYLLDVFLNNSFKIQIDNTLEEEFDKGEYLYIEDLTDTPKIKKAKPLVGKILDNERGEYFIQTSDIKNPFVSINCLKKLNINNIYKILTIRNGDENVVVWNKKLEERKVGAYSLESLDRDMSEVIFKDKDDNFFRMKNEDFLLYNSYLAYGYESFNCFNIVCSKEIIEATLKINHIYNHYKNLEAFCRAEFLTYPATKKIPTESLFISGKFANIFKDDDFKVKGYWERTKTGIIFRVIENERIFSSNLKTLKNFLILSLKGNNIGKVTIDNIVNEFGLDTIDKIKSSPKELLKVRGVSEKRADLIYKVVTESEYIENMMAYFVKNNIPLDNMIDIYDKYGLSTLEIIQSNPYTLLEVNNISFRVVDTLALSENVPYNDKSRVEACVLYYLKYDELSNGNLYTFEDDLKANLSDFILKEGVYTQKLEGKDIDPILSDTIDSGLVVREHLIDDYNKNCLYLSYNNFLENQIVKKLKELRDRLIFKPWDTNKVEDKIDNYEKKTGFKLANKQRQAVKMALTENICILTGGPGTGKTQTVNSIINIAKDLQPGVEIALSAPTGKASDRLTEITGMQASTIHRKLGYIPFGDDKDLTEIEEDILVIDESSMIDADLFYKLLSNISDETRILFVGDDNQIPSVGAGLILRDLINSSEIPVTILDEIFRQSEDSTIITKSHDIIKGITTETGLDLSNSKDFIFIPESNDFIIKQKILEIVEEERKNHHINNIQVLTPMNVGDLGTRILNYELQDKFNPFTSVEDEVRLSPTKVFRVKDKVIQTKNNYDINVFNGSLGNIDKIDKNSKTPIVVEYETEDVEYTYSDVDDLMLSYAMTIHKSQGSEFDVVIIPIHRSHLFMNNRNLLYTAITRAKTKVYIIGSEDILNKVIEKKDHIKRNSQIVSKLQGKKTEIPF